MGTIDESALNNLNLVVNLSKSLKFSTHGGDEEDAEELAKHFPSFLWVLRDFSLRLVDDFSNPITSKEYLERSLKENKGNSVQVMNKNRIRNCVKHFFRERDCATLVRPMEDESGLQNLNTLNDGDIRSEFIDQLTKLKNKVFKKVKPKKLNGQFLNGPMIIELAKAYVEALNTGKVPTIESAWDYMCTEENHKALKNSMEMIKEYAYKLSKSLPIEANDLEQHKAEIYQTAEDNFYKGTFSSMPKDAEKEFLAKIKTCLDDTFADLEKKNNLASAEIVKKYFDTNFKDVVRQNLRNDKYECYDDYEKDLEQFKDEFKENIQGEHFEKCLDAILLKFNERVAKDIAAVKTRRLELEVTAYKERMKRAEEELASGKDELNKDKQRLSNKIEELESERIQNLSRAEILAEKLKFSEQDKAEKMAQWEEKYEKIERQLKEKTDEWKAMQNKLDK